MIVFHDFLISAGIGLMSLWVWEMGIMIMDLDGIAGLGYYVLLIRADGYQ